MTEENDKYSKKNTNNNEARKNDVLNEKQTKSDHESPIDKKPEEHFELNTDSNKSNPLVVNPKSYPSSSGSTSKELGCMTPQSFNNLNVLFSQSNSKVAQNQNQRRTTNNAGIYSSPMDRREYLNLNYSYTIPISPIDPSKLSNKSTRVRPRKCAPTFHNKNGLMSINIENKQILENQHINSKFNRKIEFTKEDQEEFSKAQLLASESLAEEENNDIKKPQPRLPTSTGIGQNNISSFQHPIISANPHIIHKFKQEKEKKKFYCNCKKSKCLKLYCECFANNEFCINCNCQDCSNVVGNAEEKEEAFKAIKDKNPVAMKLNNIEEMIVVTGENKIGCNCTKSNCSKKYCECYKVNVKCSEVCRCRDCSNASQKVKEKKKMRMSSRQKEMTFDMTTEGPDVYDNFAFQKISILIENSKIFIERAEMLLARDFYDFFNLKNESKVDIKTVNEMTVIEISKSIFNDHETDTPNFSFKRKRNRSADSNSSQVIYENSYTKAVVDYIPQTACETTKKCKTNLNPLSKVIGKKLNLDECES